MNLLWDLAKVKNFKSRRMSSWDKTGRNKDLISVSPKSKAIIAEIDGPGIISHIWFAVTCNEDKNYLRKLLFRAYWDGEEKASIDAPVGDFFGVGHSCVNSYQCFLLNMSTAQPGYGGKAAMNCFFSMPFKKHAKLEIVNDCECSVGLHYYIDYQEYEKLENLLYFHAKWRRENPCHGWKNQGSVRGSIEWRKRMAGEEGVNLSGEKNYVILQAEGKGHYVGCNLSVDNLFRGWWGEGDDMIFVDGEKWPPSLHGTGTEDYFCHAWGMQNNAFLFNGLSYHSSRPFDTNRGKFTVYRYHMHDAIPFTKSIRVTIEHGHANCRSDDYSSVAYWYQTEPHRDFYPMLSVEKRLPNPFR